MEKINDEKLIFHVKKYNNLYEKCSTGYRNKFKRAKAWAEISAAMNVNETVCQSRWKNIRDRYVKIHQKKLSSGSESSVPETSWSLISHLEFLSDHIQPRKTASSVSPVDYSLLEDSNLFPPSEESSQSMNASLNIEGLEDLSSTPLTSNKRKRARECVDPVAEKMCELVTQFSKFAETKQLEANKHAPFFKMLEQKFQVIPEQDLDQIKLKMLNYVFTYARRVENQETVEDLELD